MLVLSFREAIRQLRRSQSCFSHRLAMLRGLKRRSRRMEVRRLKMSLDKRLSHIVRVINTDLHMHILKVSNGCRQPVGSSCPRSTSIVTLRRYRPLSPPPQDSISRQEQHIRPRVSVDLSLRVSSHPSLLHHLHHHTSELISFLQYLPSFIQRATQLVTNHRPSHSHNVVERCRRCRWSPCKFGMPMRSYHTSDPICRSS